MTIRACSIVGTGVAARAVAPALIGAGVPVVAVAGRTHHRAVDLAQEIGAAAAAIGDVPVDVDLILLCVTDSAIAEVVSTLTAGSDFPGAIVAHMAGSIRADVLDPVRIRGARPGKLHPLASLSGGPSRLSGAMWGVEGEEFVFAELSQLVHGLGGWPIDLRQVDLELYHLAAVFASSFMLGVMGVAVQLWNKSGAPAPAGEALIPLVRTVVANWEELGLENALTGPIARGDAVAVLAQLRRAIDEGSVVERLYRELALAAAEIAARRTGSDASAIADIVRTLAENKVLD